MKYGSVANSDYSAMHFIANLTSHAFSFLEKKNLEPPILFGSCLSRSSSFLLQHYWQPEI